MTEEIAHSSTESVADLDAVVERLAARYRPALIAYFRRRAPDKADAEDLAQEVFVRVLRRGGLDKVDNPEAFLFQAAANLVRDSGRRTVIRRQHAAEEFATAERAEVLSPERVYQGREQLTTLLAVLEELTEKTRDVFLLHRLDLAPSNAAEMEATFWLEEGGYGWRGSVIRLRRSSANCGRLRS
ncbi:MAG: RNA polymerase sigma factor, partial [Pseudomonadota bacterium]